MAKRTRTRVAMQLSTQALTLPQGARTQQHRIGAGSRGECRDRERAVIVRAVIVIDRRALGTLKNLQTATILAVSRLFSYPDTSGEENYLFLNVFIHSISISDFLKKMFEKISHHFHFL